MKGVGTYPPCQRRCAATYGSGKSKGEDYMVKKKESMTLANKGAGHSRGI